MNSKFLSEDILLITPAGYARIAKSYELLTADYPQAKREGKGYWGEDLELDQMEIIDGVAHIPVTGAIGRGLDAFDKGMGAVDVADIQDDLDTAEGDPMCRAILLNIDSPGGMVGGTPELADRILQVEKPIYAYSPGLICSAAYWLAAACDGIFATKSADIGSIGVYSAYLDRSEMAKMMGIKVQVFSSGKYKGAGVPGTALTKDQQALIQDRITSIAGMFYDHVQSMRPDVTGEDMQGQTFKAGDAVEHGLIDEMVSDIDQVLDLLR